ncbi:MULTISPECIES: thermonuclease family protein [Exiguobacterium]|uniref:thermonuclease family protein n=1 Tax=Exiguobacterium TaxID=33986 RepID=UPI001AE2C10D|nr:MULTISPECIES: thermonuclease family protein [Exiguobacterium]MCT4779171.1 thermonuclease family protein [Exiguobacterium soli]
MKQWLNKIILMTGFVFMSGCALDSEPTELLGIQQPDENQVTEATVERVIDGDTVKVRLKNGQTEDVRFLLIDTPETVNPEKPIQPFGPEASRYTKDALPAGSDVLLERDQSKADRYGRLLAYVWADGKMINQELLRKGLARVAYIYEPDTRYVEMFQEIEDEAKGKTLGIWQTKGYATDRGFDTSVMKETPMKESADCENIKGNINRQGKKIYHVESGRSYQEVNPEEMFCNEQEAKEAGFVRADN